MDEELRKLLYRKMISILEDASKQRCCKSRSYIENHEIVDPREIVDLVKDCKVTVLFFYSPTCPYCRAYTPIFLDVAEKYRGYAAFTRINVARHPGVAGYFNVMGVPTTLILLGDSLFARLVGLVDRENLERAVLSALKNAGCKVN